MAKYYDRCWNPVYGCDGAFAGCDKCYAKSLSERRGRVLSEGMSVNRKQMMKRFDATPQLMAVCTQSDLFQGACGANTAVVDRVLSKCNVNRQHRYLFLTKFSGNMREYFGDGGLVRRLNGMHLERFSFDRMAFGVSVCCRDDMHRLDDLRGCCHVEHRFVAFEPLLEEIDVTADDLEGMEWVIIGAETGDEPRKCEQSWMKRIVSVADSLSLPVFVNAVHANGKVTTEFCEMDEALRRNDIPFSV